MASLKHIAAVTLLALALVALAGSMSPATATVNANITLSSQTRYQTIEGWEAVAQAGEKTASFSSYKNQLFDLAVNDLGLNRLRVELKPISTSNAAPDFTSLDSKMDNIVMPFRQRVLARGEKFWLNLCYVLFNDTTNIRGDPQRYANYVLSAFQHIKTKYGIVPESMEIELEPDTIAAGQWTGTQVGNALVATGNLLKANGFTPEFVIPSTTSMLRASQYFDSMIQVSGALSYMGEIAYHRYADVSTANLQAIASRASQYGKRTAMLEHIGSSYPDLHQDLTVGNNSAWEQYVLAYPTTDNGAQYYTIDTSNPYSPVVRLSSRGKFLRQYFKFVRPGAVRIGATSGTSYYNAAAFINPDGRYVVVVKSDYPGLPASSAVSISGLPAGTYGIKYTTAQYYNVDLTDITLASGTVLNTNFSSAGVMTIYGKSGSSPVPSVTPTRTSTPLVSRTATRTATPVATRTATAVPSPVPGAVNMLAPANGGVVTTRRAWLSWGSAAGATGYDVRVRKTSQTGTVVVSTRVGGTSFLTPSLSNGLYYWRVRACNATGCGAWASYWSYKIKPPAPPTLLSPLSGDTAASPVGLDWSDSTGATSYRVQVRMDSTSGLLVDYASPAKSAYTTLSLAPGRWYLWHVRACSTAGCGTWSPWAEFKVP